MKILKIYIKDFGCFCDRSFDFADNLNIISGNNESGKSTLISFIKFILYGMPKKSAENAVERGRTISWSTNSASGYMQLEHGGKTYTVTRQGILRATEKRESYSEQCTITDDETGLAVHSGEVPGELFLGVPSAVFESTCFISQLGCNDISPDDVNRSLENMLISADESLSVKKSLEKLDMARKALRHKVGRGGSICELEDKKEGLKSRLRSSMDGYNKIISETESVDELRRTIIERRAELDRADDRLSALSMVSTVKRFDMLHQKEKEKAELDERLRNYKTENSLNGYIPNEEYISSLSEAISSELQAKNALSAAKKELDTERDAKRAFEEKNSVALSVDTSVALNENEADATQDGGGEIVIEDSYAASIVAEKKYKRKVTDHFYIRPSQKHRLAVRYDKKGTNPMMLLVVAAVCLVGGSLIIKISPWLLEILDGLLGAFNTDPY